MAKKEIYNQLSCLTVRIGMLKDWRDENKMELTVAELRVVNDSIVLMCDVVAILQKTFNA